ncbi:DUF6049 family protein [Aeromicrobium panaciterrae]
MAILATMIAAMLLGSPAQAADKDPDLTVTITSLSPSWLKADAKITMRGTITNNDDHAWDEVQAYLVIPATPFTTRAQLDDAIDNGDAYTGTRVIEPGAFDELGDLAPKQTVSFEITVPYGQLGISGGTGVYPIGAQVLGTDTDGTRANDAIGRATTFLPNIPSDQKPVPTTLVWPLLMPDYRGVDGNYHDPVATLALISPGGRLRNVLDLARSVPQSSATVLIDPALLVGIDDIANKRHIAKGVELTEDQTALAKAFLDELLAYLRSHNIWILDFDRPDVLALAANPDLRRGLAEAVDAATQSAITTYQISGRRVTWPTRRGVTPSLLATERRDGETPMIVTPASVPGWERRLGSLVSYDSTRGPLPLLVNDVLDAGVPGGTSVVSLRQRILSDAALAGLQRAIDSKSHADAVTMVDPTWDPGANAAGAGLSTAFGAPFARGATLDDLLTRPLATYAGRVPTTSSVKPVSRTQLQAAADLAATGKALSSIDTDDEDVNATIARQVAGIVGVRWRKDPPLGVRVANNLSSRADVELTKIKVEGPPSVTLSSSSGGFPLTIINDTADDIRVGVQLDSTNPALDIPSVKPVDIAAGERHTMTINIDLGRQNTTQLTARVVSTDGTVIAVSEAFNVRSSKIGVMLWVAIGLAGVLVLFAMFRRFHRRRSVSKSSTTDRPVDDD